MTNAIEAVGASALYLPSYSPDLNPIERFFANSRRSCARRPNELYRVFGAEFERSSAQFARGNAQIYSAMRAMGQPGFALIDAFGLLIYVVPVYGSEFKTVDLAHTRPGIGVDSSY